MYIETFKNIKDVFDTYANKIVVEKSSRDCSSNIPAEYLP